MEITTEDTMEVAKKIEKRLKELQILTKDHRKTKHVIQFEINDMLGLNEYQSKLNEDGKEKNRTGKISPLQL